MALNWYLNGINLKDYGITVSGSLGLVDGLKRKDPFKVDLPDYHGEIVDLEKTIYESRDITLNCWIKASGMLDFTTKVNTFNLALREKGTHRFMVEIDPSKPLVYEVYFPDKTTIDKKWDDSTMVGTFSLKMRESEPVKRVLKYIAPNEDNPNYALNTASEFTVIKPPSGLATKAQSLSKTLTDKTEDLILTLTFEAKSIVENKRPFSDIVVGRRPTGDNWSYRLGFSSFKQELLSDGYVRYSRAYTLKQSEDITWTTEKNIVFIIEYNVTDGGYFRNVQLQEGDISTDWTPSPSDFENGLSINFNTNKLINIHWGDGSHEYDIVGNNVKLTHEYKEDSIYYIIITGVIEEIEAFKSNIPTIWNIL